ncbi:MAG: hypothetical protein ABJH82_00925 [Polaribacter sp.]|uniref:hypothetical protein n=1 Tax=Polaribacter sp. TaxID=1920175 RepID=UPI003264D560
MNYKTFILIFALFLVTGFHHQQPINDEPLFFSMGDEWKDIVKDVPVFNFKAKSLDSSYTTHVAQEVRLLSNSKKQPVLFFSDIETAVCADGECKLANLKIYWNLLGNYVGFGIDPDLPLTKFEHDVFETEDYAKLHELLLDEHSILKRRKMSDLIDTVYVSPSNLFSKNIDAVSGATKAEIKESVVKGGLYSCYTLWHIVHGEVKEKMKTYIDSIHSDELITYFLDSPYRDYQQYALKQITAKDYEKHIESILQIFKTNDALTRAYILKKIPDSLFSDQKVSTEVYQTFPNIDVNTRTLLIKRIAYANAIAVEILSESLEDMTKNQLKFYLNYLEKIPAKIDKKIEFNLIKTSKNQDYTYSYLIKKYLKNKK